jgi:bacterial/archaeal transporter family-2 protein
VTAVAAPPRTATLALAAAVAAGAGAALQQRVNGALREDLRSTVLAALVNFLSGLALVAAYVVIRPSARRAVARVRDVPVWSRLGGLGGAGLIAVGAAAAPRVGVAMLTVGLVAGQTTGGVVVDRFGIGPSSPRPLTAPRVGGALLCLVAVAISVAGGAGHRGSPLLLVLVVAAGFLVSVQQGLNGRVRRETGDVGVATLVNFLVGTAALLGGLVAVDLVQGLSVGDWPGAGHWYLYVGGPIGAAFVAVSAAVVRRLGVLRLALAVIAGQLVGALLLDLVVPAAGTHVAAATLVGAALTLVAVAVSGAGGRTP